MGFEGDEYEWKYVDDAKSAYTWTDAFTNTRNALGLSLVEYLHKCICLGGGPANMNFMTPSYSETYDNTAQVIDDNRNAYWPYLKDTYYCYGVVNTAEESERLTILGTDLTNYYRQTEAELITGVKSLDDWDSIKATFEKMGADEYLKISTDAFNRMIG